MSQSSLLLPLVVAAGLAALTAAVHRRLPPPVAARSMTVSLVVVAAAALPSIWLLGLSFLAHLPFVGAGFEWCAKAVGMHDDIPWIVGAPAVAMMMLGTPRAVRVLFLDWRLRIHTPGPVEYVDTPEPYAVTVPGRGGRIVISTGLLNIVDDAELDAVIAHEHTHAHYRHDRYLLIARTISAAIPFVKPFTERLRFALERWADEHAARRCGDRRTIAAALAKVALAQPMAPTMLGFGNLGVTARVEALIAAPPPRLNPAISFVLWTSIGATAILGVVQLHHLGRLVAALCPT
jgi:Peptidase family M48